MTAARQPLSAISRNIRCKSKDSGVVCPLGLLFTPVSFSTVPMSPHGTPAFLKTSRRSQDTVVFPFVPVTPISVSSLPG